MKSHVIGVDVGGTKTAYGVFNEAKELVFEYRRASDPSLGPADFFDGIIADIRKITDELEISFEGIRGVGLAMPSFIHFESGHIIKTSNLTNIRDFPARDYVSDKLDGLPVVLGNDAQASALAEYRMGAGRGTQHMLYCPVSTGISSAIIIDGKLFRGSYGWAGESGHMVLSPGEGIECGCGNRGCAMSWSSGGMIVRHIREWIEAGGETLLTSLAESPEEIDCRRLEEAFDRGDPMARKALEQMALYMGTWLYNLYVTFNINFFVFGGGLTSMGEKLFGPVRSVFDGYNQNDMPVYFKTAELGDRCGIMGAAEFIFEN